MAPTVAQILALYEAKPELVERIANRDHPTPLKIVDPNPEWPARYQEVKSRIEKALGPQIVKIAHVGSTSIPNLPAKDQIDVDLALKDIHDEAAYVKPLEDAGFRFLLREPYWHDHRYFSEDWPGAFSVSLHVWGPDSPEMARHLIFQEWLAKNPEDLKRYTDIKREAAQQSSERGEDVNQYNARKAAVIHGILDRAFRDLGYIE